MAFISYSTSSFSAVIDIQGGVLMGATGVSVGGSLYDVSFKDGTCADLFNGCDDASDFFFPVSDISTPTLVASEAMMASQALLDQVFIDSALGDFDSDPTLTNGCNRIRDCSAYTPVFAQLLGGANYFTSIFANNNWIDERADTTGALFGTPVGADFFIPGGNIDLSVFAIWSNNVSPGAVPVPPAIWLFGSGIIGLIGMRKYHHKASTLSA